MNSFVMTAPPTCHAAPTNSNTDTYSSNNMHYDYLKLLIYNLNDDRIIDNGRMIRY